MVGVPGLLRSPSALRLPRWIQARVAFLGDINRTVNAIVGANDGQRPVEVMGVDGVSLNLAGGCKVGDELPSNKGLRSAANTALKCGQGGLATPIKDPL